ncbi:MAG: cob(I)yrinic acid a,c-diamide adenosyltransferase [Candidatus Omnitrophota bacterium]
MIQVYTGNGKGKTTAALGLAIRAAGAGLRVYIVQFLKGRPYSELASLKKFRNITLVQCGQRCFIKNKPKPRDLALAKKGLAKIENAIKKKCYHLIILDEVNIAMRMGMLEINEVVAVLKKASAKTEFVLTGRYAPSKIIGIADLVSEIRERKHYYRKDVKARKGIEF